MKLKENQILIIIFILYLVSVIFVGAHHEPWFDEAQAWLIARENSYGEILNVLSKEGHPFIWYYILRTLYLCGLDYNFLFLVSISFVAFGVYLFIFKTDFPIFVKALVPFSYPIFYQYAIVSRSYCLIFPTLMLFAIFYRKYRYTNPYLVVGTLIFLSGISLYTTFLSFILLLIYLYDLFKNRKFSIRVFQSILFLFYFYFFTYSYLHLYERNVVGNFFQLVSKSVFAEYLYLIKLTLFAPSDYNNLQSVLTIFVFIFLLFCFYKNVYKAVGIILVSLLYYYYFLQIKLSPWHCDLFLVFVFFLLSLDFKEEHKQVLKNKLFYSLITFVLLLSFYYTLVVSYNDVRYNYDTSKKMALFLQRNDYLDKKIYAYDFKSYALLPYLKDKKFINSDKTWFVWVDSLSHQFIGHVLAFNKNVFNDIERYKADVVIYSTFTSKQDELYKFLKEKNISYSNLCFDAKMYYKNTILEDNGYCLVDLKRN